VTPTNWRKVSGFIYRGMNSMKTGEVARLINVSKRTLQNWLKSDKIEPPQKGVNGYYEWTNADICAARDYKIKLERSTRYRLKGG
jgi:DNA-binding transcriptional MerR regulator